MTKYYLGFDVETAGEYHENQLMSIAFSLVDDNGDVVNQRLFIIVPEGIKKTARIDAEIDYCWSARCWNEFGKVHIDTINATQNTPSSGVVTRVKLRNAAAVVRKYYDDVCSKYRPKVGVDNPAYDCMWVSRLLTASNMQPLEYQARDGVGNVYAGIIGYSSVLRYLPRPIVDVPNDHNPMNDSLRHALFVMHLEHLRQTPRE